MKNQGSVAILWSHIVCIVALCQVWQTSIEYGGADTNLVLWRSLEYRLSFRIQLPVAAKLSAITSWDGNSDKHHPLCRTSVQIAMWSAQAPAVSRIRRSDWLRLQRNPQHSPSWSTDVRNEEEERLAKESFTPQAG